MEPKGGRTYSDGWQVNDWVKKAVIMYFPIAKMETIEVGPLSSTIRYRWKKDLRR